MSRHLHLDPVCGISGDMFLGALLDAGASIDDVRQTVAALGIDGWSIEPEIVSRHGITGTLANVATADQSEHRSATTLTEVVTGAALDPWVREQSCAVLNRLAAVEARIHGVPIDDVHLHELGALDTLVDIVGVVAALHSMEITTVSVSALPTGSGTVRTAHGELPVPAPATLAVLAGTGIEWRPSDEPMELVTPTGAALLAQLASPMRPTMSVESIGHGFGRSTRLPKANMTRALVGTLPPVARPLDRGRTDTVVQLQSVVDDQTAEHLAYALRQCLDAGALDGWMEPVTMKKGRLGTQLTLLCTPAAETVIVDCMFRFTTTLGIRRSELSRYLADRHLETTDVNGHPVRRKVRTRNGVTLGAKAEFDDCVRVASALGLTPADVARHVENLRS